MKRNVHKRESLARVKLSPEQLEASRARWQKSPRWRRESYSAWVRHRIGAVVEEQEQV